MLTETVHLDGNTGFNSPENRPTLFTYFRDSTLGAGGKFGFELNKNFTLEAVVNFFPQNGLYSPVVVPSGRTVSPAGSTTINAAGSSSSGRLTQGLFGLKARIYGNDRFVLSAKIRPGVVSFGNVVTPIEQTFLPNLITSNVSTTTTFFGVSSGRQTGFAFDYGAILDLDTGRHTFLSLEFGETMMHLPVVRPIGLPTNNLTSLVISAPSVRSTNNLQLSTGFGLRF